MKAFISKYWWIILSITGLVFLYYWFYMRNDSSSISTSKTTRTGSQLPPKTNPNCPTSVSEWESKVSTVIKSIKFDANWRSFVLSNKFPGETDEEAYRRNAEWQLVENQGECNPTEQP